MNILRLMLLAWAFAAPQAHAAMIIAVQNQETPLAINAELGSIVQLPSVVKTVTPSRYFSLQDVGAEAGGTGLKADVRTFLIKPIVGAATEVVTFVLASGRALALRLIPTSNGEKFYDLQHESGARRGQVGKFLGDEMAMMRAMLLDEAGGFARELIDEQDKEKSMIPTDIDGLDFVLARIYAASDLTGYVFRVRNRSSAPIDLNLSSFAVARPNRAILSQADKMHLDTCPMLLVPTSACQTALRLVVRGPKPSPPLISALGNPVPPFAKAATPVEGAKP